MNEHVIRDHILNTILDISSEQIEHIHAEFVAASQQSRHLSTWTPQTLSRLVDHGFPFDESPVVSPPPLDLRSFSPRFPNESRNVSTIGPANSDPQSQQVTSVTNSADGIDEAVPLIDDETPQFEYVDMSSVHARPNGLQAPHSLRSLRTCCPQEPPSCCAPLIPKGMRPIVGRMQKATNSPRFLASSGDDATINQASRRALRKYGFCNYCRNNNESTQVYASHLTENCPILSKFECPNCKQRGHTISHCKLSASNNGDDVEAPKERSILMQMLKMNAKLGAVKY